MNLTDARIMAEKLMDEYGLIHEGWVFEFGNKKCSYGTCSYRRKTIYLSAPNTILNDEAHVENVIRHEIAHALVGPGHGHNIVWKSMAIKVGANPERCSTGPTVKGRFNLVCGCCNKIIINGRHRRSDMSRRYHPICGRKSLGQLKWIMV